MYLPRALGVTLIALGLVLVGPAACATAGSAPPCPPALMPASTGVADASTRELVIQRRDGSPVVVPVEVVDTPASRQCGLSRRAQLAPGWGMWFVFPDEAPRVFTLRETAFPLDLIFVDAAHHVVQVVAGARAYAPDLIASEVPAAYVLEVAAGSAAAWRLAPGDRVAPRPRAAGAAP